MASLDAQVALASGLPSIIETRYYDVAPITELSETAISSPPVQGSETIKEIGRIFVSGRFEFYRRMNDFIHLLHNDHLNENDLDKLLTIVRDNQKDCYNRREQVAMAVQNSITGGAPATGTDVFSKFAKMVICMWAAKPLAILYGPLRRHGLLERLHEKEPA